MSEDIVQHPYYDFSRLKPGDRMRIPHYLILDDRVLSEQLHRFLLGVMDRGYCVRQWSDLISMELVIEVDVIS